jgi:thiamine biosynthesis protein ThiS
MNLTINGETRDVADGLTVLCLLEELGFRPEVTVVERNADILERAKFGDVTLADGDTLEIVRFVGGG